MGGERNITQGTTPKQAFTCAKSTMETSTTVLLVSLLSTLNRCYTYYSGVFTVVLNQLGLFN